MARMTPTQIDAADNYTNAQLLKLVRYAIAELLSDPDATVTFGTRSYTRQNLEALRRQEEFYAARAADDADASAVETIGCPVVRNQEEQT